MWTLSLNKYIIFSISFHFLFWIFRGIEIFVWFSPDENFIFSRRRLGRIRSTFRVDMIEKLWTRNVYTALMRRWMEGNSWLDYTCLEIRDVLSQYTTNSTRIMFIEVPSHKLVIKCLRNNLIVCLVFIIVGWRILYAERYIRGGRGRFGFKLPLGQKKIL